jgi:hypothetical protein
MSTLDVLRKAMGLAPKHGIGAETVSQSSVDAAKPRSNDADAELEEWGLKPLGSLKGPLPGEETFSRARQKRFTQEYLSIEVGRVESRPRTQHVLPPAGSSSVGR